MKTRTAAVAILLSFLLATAGAARGASARRGAEGEAGLTREEEREARTLAASFARRFAATRDFAPLVEEFFVEDLAERLRGEASAEDTPEDSFPLLKFVAPETLRQLSASELRRFYAAVVNCYLLAELHGRVAKFVKNERRSEEENEVETELGDYFPPDALAAARRDPMLASMIEEADDSDTPSEPEADAERGGKAEDDQEKDDDGRPVLKSVRRVNEATAVMEEVTAKMRTHLKSLPAWPVAHLLGEDLSAGELAKDGTMSLRARKISQPFRGEPEGALLICATARMIHVDLVKAGGRFKVLNVSSEEYEARTEEQKRRGERLAEFFKAIESGDAETFDAILRDGINVNAKQSDGGMTPLHYAAQHRRLDMLRTLVAAGANVNAKNAHGHAALSYALGSAELTAALLSAGADVSGQNGRDALEAAAAQYNNKETPEVVRILKSYGARE